MITELPDDALLRRYREDDAEEDFTELVRRHVDLVYGLAFRELRDAQFAEDVSQRVFTALARKGKRETIRHLAAWLYGVTQKEVLFMMRSEKRRRERELKASEFDAIAKTESPDKDSMEVLSGVLASALQRLSDGDQKALFLRFYEEQEFQDIGATLGIQERAAQKRVYRAMDRLRKVLRKRGVTATAAIFSSQLFTAGAAPAPVGLASSLSNSALQTAALGTGGVAALLSSVKWPLAALGVGSAGLLAMGPVKERLLISSSAQEMRGATIASEAALETEQIAIDAIEAIYRLPSARREAALVALIDHLEVPRDEAYLTDLFTRWTELDAERNARAIVALASRLPAGADDREIVLREVLQIPLAPWWREDAQDVESWVSALPRTERGERVAFGALVRTVSGVDPLHAYTLVAARGGTGDESYEVLAKAFAKNGPSEARTLLGQLPETSAPTVASTMDADVLYQDDKEPRLRLYEAMLPSFLADSPQATADWIVALPADATTAGITASFVGLWANEAPQEAAAWALELSPEERQEALPRLAKTWLVKEEEEALAWIQAQAHDDDAQLVSAVVDHLGPEQSLGWAGALEHRPMRKGLQAHAFFALGLTESREVLQDRLRQLSSDDEIQLAGAALAQGMLVSQGRAAVVAWRNELEGKDPLLAHALWVGELDVLAALNPHMAAKMISEMPKNERHDEALEILFQRTMSRGEEARDQAKAWVGQLGSPEKRRQWLSILEHTHTDTSPQALPKGLKNGFEAQSYAEFRERLDGLATMPLRAQ